MNFEINVTHLGKHRDRKGIEKSWFKVALCDDTTQQEAEAVMSKLRAVFTESVSVDLYAVKRETLKSLSSTPALSRKGTR